MVPLYTQSISAVINMKNKLSYLDVCQNPQKFRNIFLKEKNMLLLSSSFWKIVNMLASGYDLV